jgi:hypothetical protein
MHVTRQVGVDVLVSMFMLAQLELRARDSDGGLEVAPRSMFRNVRSMYVLPGEWGFLIPFWKQKHKRAQGCR